MKWYFKSILLIAFQILFFACQKPDKPPIVTITDGPTGSIPVSSATFRWIGNDVDGTVSGYYIDLDKPSPETWTTDTSHTFTNLSDNNYTFYIQSKDNDGKTSTVESQSFKVHLTYPIKVSEPSDSTVWYQDNQDVLITWDPGDLGGFVSIILYKGTDQVATISSGTNNNGSYNIWDVPSDITAGTDYRVKVYFDATHYAFSDNFEIKVKPVTVNMAVTSPTGSTVWTNREYVTIGWDPGNLCGTVSIFLCRGTEQVSTISSSTNNNGSYSGWVVPSDIPEATDYRVKIYFDATHYGYSDNFELKVNIVAMTPNSSTVWTYGDQNVPITWDTGNLGGSVQISLWLGSIEIVELSSSTNNDGSWIWNVPSNIPPAKNYRVRIYLPNGSSKYDYSDYFEIKAKTINTNIVVLNPNSSTIWYYGDALSITWDHGNLGGTVSIILYKGTDQVSTISSSINNNGFTQWQVPFDITWGTDYSVRIYFDASHYDFSDNFEIKSGQIFVTSPNSSTVWYQGEQNVLITWNTGRDIRPIGLRFFRVGAPLGELYSWTITSSTENDGSYSWNVPTDCPPGNQYYVELGNVDSNPFKIQTPNIVVTNPYSSTVWTQGDQNVSITWGTGNLGGTVSISLYKGTDQVSTLTSSTDNNGIYNIWDVPPGITPGTDYRVRVYSDASQYDYSEYFEIKTTNIVVTNPVSSSLWTQGDQNVPITWNTGNLGGTVSILLYNGTGLIATISTSTDNNGSYGVWNVPSDITPGTSYRIRVYYDAGHYDDSDNFEIKVKTQK